MLKANISKEEGEEILVHTKQCQGCSFDPLQVIEQSYSGTPTCPICRRSIILNDLVFVKDQQTFQQSQTTSQTPTQIPEDKDEDKYNNLLADQLTIFIRPKSEQIGWVKALDAPLIETEQLPEQSKSLTLDDLSKEFEDLTDDDM
jgi:hypothetical protein